MSEDFGISATGFNRKRLDQILADKNSDVKAVFGENFNVAPESPDGQINGSLSESDALLWEIAEEAYNAFNPSAAAGVTLSNLVQLNAITRNAATSSRTQLTLTGTALTVIPLGSLVSTSDTGDQFATETEVTLDGAGNGTVFASSVITGPTEALAGTLTVIDTPVTGWATVTNVADADKGTNEETDPDLRARRIQSTASNAQSVIDALFAAVADLDGVTRTVVLENDTDITDAAGLPPHSFQVIVIGGVDAEIGLAIWLKKPAGITSFGNTSTPILDSQGISHTISFSRATEIPIFVEVDVTTFAAYPANGDDLIKQAIVDYANGILVPGRGFSLAEDVIYTRLYTPINSVPGHEIDDLQIGLSAPATGVINIPISATEISLFTIANIVVNS